VITVSGFDPPSFDVTEEVILSHQSEDFLVVDLVSFPV